MHFEGLRLRWRGRRRQQQYGAKFTTAPSTMVPWCYGSPQTFSSVLANLGLQKRRVANGQESSEESACGTFLERSRLK